jgi:hypothetical protein
MSMDSGVVAGRGEAVTAWEKSTEAGYVQEVAVYATVEDSAARGQLQL